MGLHHKVLLELNSDFHVQIKLNRNFPVQFEKHFMMQPCQGVFPLSIQLFFLECSTSSEALMEKASHLNSSSL